MTKRAAKRPLVTAGLLPDRIFVVKRKGKMGTTEKTEIRKQAIRRVLTRWINNRKAETEKGTASQTETAANAVTGKTDCMEKPVLTDHEKPAADHSENGMTSPAPDLPATTGREQAPATTVSSRDARPYREDTGPADPQAPCRMDTDIRQPP